MMLFAVLRKPAGTLPPCAARYAWYTSAVAPAVTGVERLVPPQVSQAVVPSITVFSVASPEEYAPSATTSTPGLPVAPGPRLENVMTSLSTTWLMREIESQPVPPNCVEAPTMMPADGAGEVLVP